MQYCFILGHNPTLSIAEISQVLNNDFRLVELSARVLIIKSQAELNAEQLQQRLGGTIKIGQIISRINTNFNTNNTNIIREISDKLVKIGKTAKRVYFGFSLYDNGTKIKDFPHKADQPWAERFKIKNLALKIKKELKEKNISSRWVSSKNEALSSVVVQKNKLLTQGAEFCFLVGAQNFYLAKTLSCQQADEYSYYDFGRPARSMKQGMLPPKLAKIMINLAQAPQSGVILDPFCGAGTILQEAIMMGYRHLIATDIDDEAIARTSTNIDWLIKQQKINFSDPPRLGEAGFHLKIFPADVRVLSQLLTPGSIDAIVTEPYLGPVKISNFSAQGGSAFGGKSQILNLISELSELYLAAFRELKQVLKKDGRLVIVFPVFSARGGFAVRLSSPSKSFGEKANSQLHYLPIIDEVKKHGWQIINPVPPELKNNSAIKITARDSIIYSRPDQMVLREILIFIRNS